MQICLLITPFNYTLRYSPVMSLFEIALKKFTHERTKDLKIPEVK